MSEVLIGSPNEGDVEDIVLFSDFMRMLAAPPRGHVGASERRGEHVFREIGCANCHLPTLITGRHSIHALDRVTFHPYSDFLLHDMGHLGGGVEQGSAEPREMRTAPLWGLRTQPAFLHDGRASTIEEAILGHDGQGHGAKQRFRKLSNQRKGELLDFLNSL